mmetsp:Transcript_85783/g.256969  ORF Transcript_85783/g.256969 Transcript_85783/m.256969 type:complete len:441 (-) Transcript_85783:291-1613(-)
MHKAGVFSEHPASVLSVRGVRCAKLHAESMRHAEGALHATLYGGVPPSGWVRWMCMRALRSTLQHTVGPAARDHTRVERGKGLEDPVLVVLLERELGHEARRVVDVAAARAAIGGARAVEDEVAQVHVRLPRRRDPGPLLGPGVVARPRVDLAAVVDAHRERREEELGRLLRREAHLPEQVGAVAALERLVLVDDVVEQGDAQVARHLAAVADRDPGGDHARRVEDGDAAVGLERGAVHILTTARVPLLDRRQRLHALPRRVLGLLDVQGHLEGIPHAVGGDGLEARVPPRALEARAHVLPLLAVADMATPEPGVAVRLGIVLIGRHALAAGVVVAARVRQPLEEHVVLLRRLCLLLLLLLLLRMRRGFVDRLTLPLRSRRCIRWRRVRRERLSRRPRRSERSRRSRRLRCGRSASRPTRVGVCVCACVSVRQCVRACPT